MGGDFRATRRSFRPARLDTAHISLANVGSCACGRLVRAVQVKCMPETGKSQRDFQTTMHAYTTEKTRRKKSRWAWFGIGSLHRLASGCTDASGHRSIGHSAGDANGSLQYD